MSSEQQVVALSAELKEKAGTGAARAVRRENRLPGIVYGGKAAQVLISLDDREFNAIYRKGHFTSKIVELTIGKEKLRVLPRDVQLDPVSDAPLHVDFQRLTKGEAVRVNVAVRFANADKSPGIKRGGILNIVRRDIEMFCDPDHIPTHITIDLNGRRIGESIHVSQIELPKGAKPVIADRDFTIATIAGRGGKDDDAEAATPAAAAAPAAAPAAKK